MKWIDPLGLQTNIINVESGKGEIFPHSALQVTSNNGENFLYDPGGSYVPPSGNQNVSGQFYNDADGSLDAFVNYWKNQGNNVNVTTLNTTPQQEAQIINNATKLGGQPPGFCAGAVSTALDGVCGVKPSGWPNNLQENAKNAACPTPTQ